MSLVWAKDWVTNTKYDVDDQFYINNTELCRVTVTHTSWASPDPTKYEIIASKLNYTTELYSTPTVTIINNLVNERFIQLNCTANSIAVSLPPVGTMVGVKLHFKKIDASLTNNIVITPDVTEFIDWDISLTILPVQWTSVTIVNDWNNWFLI